MPLALDIVKAAKDKGVKLYFPDSIVVADKFDNDAKTQRCKNTEVPDGWMGMDAAQDTIDEWRKVILAPRPFFGTVPPAYLRCLLLPPEHFKLQRHFAEATAAGDLL